MSRPRIALVVPGFGEFGGLPAVALFLERALAVSGRYTGEIVSLPLASDDPGSVRLTDPRSWLRGVAVERGEWHGHAYTRVGALGAELEVQRFRPRRPLTRLLDDFDLVQVVAGAPTWALVARHVRRPLALQVATLTGVERQQSLRGERGPLGAWRRLMTAVASRLEPAALRGVDVAFVENRWMQEALARHMEASRIVFAPPGVDTERFRPAPTPAPEGHLLAVGRFADPRKRADLLFQAYAQLCERVERPPRLLLAGANGPPPADWALAERLGIRPRIELREGVSDAELAELYRGAVLFALSSEEEGFGLAVVEAMACGLPVVATDCGGPATSVVEGETGFLTPPGDAAALAERMGRLLADPALRERMGRRGRERAVSEFSLEIAARPFLDTYDRLLAEAGSLRRDPLPRT